MTTKEINTTDLTLTWDEFEEKFNPIQNIVTKREEFNGWIFETYDQDINYIHDYNNNRPDHVWTIIDAGVIQIVSGYHFVNRLGYVITAKPFDPAIYYSVIDPEDIEDFKDEEYCGEVEEYLSENFGLDLTDLDLDKDSLSIERANNITPADLVESYAIKYDLTSNKSL